MPDFELRFTATPQLDPQADAKLKKQWEQKLQKLVVGRAEVNAEIPKQTITKLRNQYTKLMNDIGATSLDVSKDIALLGEKYGNAFNMTGIASKFERDMAKVGQTTESLIEQHMVSVQSLESEYVNLKAKMREAAQTLEGDIRTNEINKLEAEITKLGEKIKVTFNADEIEHFNRTMGELGGKGSSQIVGIQEYADSISGIRTRIVELAGDSERLVRVTQRWDGKQWINTSTQIQDKTQKLRDEFKKFDRQVQDLEKRYKLSEAASSYAQDWKNMLLEMKGFSAEVPGAREQLEKWQTVLSTTKGELGSAGNNLSRYKEQLKDVRDAEVALKVAQLESHGLRTTAVVQAQAVVDEKKEEAEETKRLLVNTDRLNDANTAYAKSEEALRKQLDSTEKSWKRQHGLLSNISSGFADATARVLNYTAVYRTMWMVVQKFRQSIDVAKELDKAFTSIELVTLGTADATKQLRKEYADLAVEMSATVTAVAEGADAWLRQGKSAEEATQLIKASMIMSRIGAIQSSEATEYLTSVLNGYKMETEDVMHVVDAMSQVDIESASSIDDLAIALQRSTATAQQAGVSFERLLGYVAAVRETTQRSASVIGEAMKSILSRMGSVKAGTFLSEDLESEYTDISTYVNDVEKVLSKVGIRLRDTNKDFRDAQDVLDDVAKAWDTYDDLTKQSLATAIAGTRQRENFLALMQSYDKALELENSALNSNGKAMQKYAVYQDSIAAKQDRINASAQTWVQNMNFEWAISNLLSLGEAFMKFFSNENVVAITKFTAVIIVFARAVKPLSTMIQLFTQMNGVVSTGKLVTQIFGAAGLGTVLPVLAAVAVGITAIVWAIQKFHKSTNELQKELQGFDSDVDASKDKIEDYKDKIVSNNEKIRELQALADRGVATPVDQDELTRLKEENTLIERQIALEEKRLEVIEAQRKAAAAELYGKTFTVNQYEVGVSRSSSIGEEDVLSRGVKRFVSAENVLSVYQDEIDDLTEAMNDAIEEKNFELVGSIQATIAELEDERMNTVLPILEQLKDYYPSIAEAVDEYYDSLLTVEERFQNVVKEADAGDVVNLSNLAKAIKAQDDLNEEMKEYGSQIDLNNRKILQTKDIDSEIAEEMGDGVATLYSRTYTAEDFGKKGTEAILVTPILPNGEVFENWETLESYIESLFDGDGKIDLSKDTEGVVMGVFDEGSIEASIEKADEFGESAHEMNQVVEEVAETMGLDGFTGTLDSLYDALENTTNEGLKKMIEALKEQGYEMPQIVQLFLNMANAADKFSNSVKLETPASQIGKFKDKVAAVVSAEEELADSGYVSADAAAELAKVYSDDVYDAMEWTSKGYKVSREELEKLIASQRVEYELALDEAQRAAAAASDANIDETMSYKQKTQAILDAIQAKKIELAMIARAGIHGAGPMSQEAQDAVNAIQEFQKYEKELAILQENLDTYDETISYLRTSTSSKKSKDTETAYELEVRLLEHELYLSEQIGDIYKDNDDEVNYRKEVNKQLEIYQKLMDAVHAEADRLRAKGYKDESEEIQKLQQAWWGYYNERRDLQQGLSDWEKQNAEDTAQKVEDALGEVKDAINDLLDEAEDALDDKLDALEAKIKKNEAIKALHESFFGILSDVADGMHEIDKALEESMSSADYLDENLRQAMFNEEDYKKMSDKLNDIADESREMFKDYLNQLEMLADDEIYKADYITSEFERQYEYKQLEYDVAEKELELAKAQTKLQNTLMNRNVRMYKNGEWIWTADYSAVEEAKQEVRDAEYEKKDAEIKLKQQEVLDKYAGIIDGLNEQKDAAQQEFDTLKKMWEKVQKQLTTEEDAMTRLLKAINETDIPQFKQIINSVGAELAKIIGGVTGADEVGSWESPTGASHYSGYGINDSFGTKSGGSAISGDNGKSYGVYDENQNYIGSVDAKTGEITWNGDPDIGNRRDIMNEVINEVKSSGSSGSGGSSGKNSSSGSYTGKSSSGGTYTIGSDTGKNFVDNAKPGDKLEGSDGSTWIKNKDGSTTITTKGGNRFNVYDSGGVLRGVGGIKATNEDETVFGPNLSSKILSPQKSKEFLASANALTKMLDNSSAFNAMLNRFASVVTGGGNVTNDSHDVYFNGNPLSGMTKADSFAMNSVLRRYVPISGGGR